MKSKENLTRGVLFVLLVALGVVSRVGPNACYWLPPNFQAVAGTALFAGYFFRSRVVALLVPLAAMLISDRVLGGYDREVMIAVYVASAMPVLFGNWLERRLSAMRVVGAAVTSSVLYFLVTNLAVWYAWYPHTTEGMTRCFVLAIPFFGHTLAGDLFFGCGLFGLYWLATAAARQRKAASSQIAEQPRPAQS